MPENILYPEWRKQQETTRYPFGSRASLINADGRTILDGTILDASLYPVGGQAGLYLSRVDVTHATITLTVGDTGDRARASGSFAVGSPPDLVALSDRYGRPAGVFVSESRRWIAFQTWGVGSYAFRPDETEFCASVCVPTPEVGVRGIALEDGSLLFGDVWLVGDDGVVLRTATVAMDGPCGQADAVQHVIRVDVVGDPLFRRRLCEPSSVFHAPRFIKTVRATAGNMTFDCVPDGRGNLRITANNALASDTALRIVTTPDGLRIRVAGSLAD